METSIDLRFRKIEQQLRFYKLGFFTACTLGATLLYGFSFANKKIDVIHAKGLVIEDQAGKPRIVISGDLSKIPGRKREDALSGIAYLDELGVDRLTFGKEPDPMTAEGIKPRRVAGAGLLIHDKDGVERGGYGVLDDETALMTLDWPKTGEAAVVSSSSDFSGMALFHRSSIGQYREAITLGAFRKNDASFIRITDASSRERLVIQTSGDGQPEIKHYDQQGRSLQAKR